MPIAERGKVNAYHIAQVVDSHRAALPFANRRQLIVMGLVESIEIEAIRSELIDTCACLARMYQLVAEV